MPDDDPRWAFVAQDLAELACVLLLTTAPHRILIGGGVGLSRSFLLPVIRSHVVELLAGYLPHITARSAQDIIVQPGLGADAGPLGAIALGAAALDAFFLTDKGPALR